MIKNLLSGDATNPSSGYSTYIILGILLVAFVVMFVMSSRSNKKRAKEAQEKLDNLKVGDKVKTIGGICGYVEEINNEENTFVLKTGSDNAQSYIKFDKVAVYQTESAVSETSKTAKTEQTEDKATETIGD